MRVEPAVGRHHHTATPQLLYCALNLWHIWGRSNARVRTIKRVLLLHSSHTLHIASRCTAQPPLAAGSAAAATGAAADTAATASCDVVCAHCSIKNSKH